MKTTVTKKETTELLVRKGICIEFFSAYQDLDLRRMIKLCVPEGNVSFEPLGSKFSGKINEIGIGVWSALMDSFPDLDNLVTDQHYDAIEKTVTCKVEIFGTQEKNFADVLSKGKRFSSEHIFIFRFNENDKIEEIKISWDHERFVDQLS